MTGNDSRGLTQIYTGNGKGKTSAALGLALRASGHNLKVIFIQFLKGTICGEHKFISKYSPFEIIKINGDDCFYKPKEELAQLARTTLEIAYRSLTDGEYDIVILDELFMALQMRLITMDEILYLIDNKPEPVELIMTGRMAPVEIIQRADLVTEMTMIKHPYNKGIPARLGIEY